MSINEGSGIFYMALQSLLQEYSWVKEKIKIYNPKFPIADKPLPKNNSIQSNILSEFEAILENKDLPKDELPKNESFGYDDSFFAPIQNQTFESPSIANNSLTSPGAAKSIKTEGFINNDPINYNSSPSTYCDILEEYSRSDLMGEIF